MPEEQQTDKWAEAGFPNVRFNPMLRAATALWSAIDERNPSSGTYLQPSRFRRIAYRTNAYSGYHSWFAYFNSALRVCLAEYYNPYRWSGRFDYSSMGWTIDDMKDVIQAHSKWTLDDDFPVTPDENLANAYREALQRLRYRAISSSIGWNVTHFSYTYHGDYVPGFEEQFSLLKTGDVTNYRIEPSAILWEYAPYIILHFQKPGERLWKRECIIYGEMYHNPFLDENSSGFKKRLLAKYEWKSYVGGVSGSYSEGTFLDDPYTQNANSHELFLEPNQSGEYHDIPLLEDMSLLNAENLPQDEINIICVPPNGPFTNVSYVTYYDAKDDFIYKSYDNWDEDTRGE